MDIELRADQEEHLKKLCAEMDRSVDDFVRDAILTFMEDYEDRRDGEAALAAGGPTFTQEEMEREFGLEHREYTNTTRRQLKKLDPQVSKRIVQFMGERIASGDPYAIGAGLTGLWAGYWKYRVGDYRVVCLIRNEKLTVLVVKIGHRSEIYERGGPQSLA